MAVVNLFLYFYFFFYFFIIIDYFFFFFFQAEDGIRDADVTGVQTCALPIWENVEKIQSGLKARNFNLGKSNTPVTPVILEGSPVEATIMAKDLRENHGIFVSVVVYPVIPKGTIIFRIIPTAVHTDEDIELTLEAFSAIREKLDSGFYKKEAEKIDLDYTQY